MSALKDLAFCAADGFGPLAYMAGKLTATIYAVSHINGDDPVSIGVKYGIGIYGGVSGLVEMLRGLQGPNLNTLGPDRTYQTNGHFAPLEIAILRNIIVGRRNAQTRNNTIDSRSQSN